jgi:hypothetical protein
MQQTQRDEITRQLSIMKKQVDIELKRDLEAMKARIMQETRAIMRNVASEILNEIPKRVSEEISKQREGVLNDINKQIVARDGVSKELALEISNNTGKIVYNKIMSDLNNTIVPKMNHLERAVKYHTQDTTELITDYRRAVYEQKRADSVGMISDGKDVCISEHVNLFFNEND